MTCRVQEPRLQLKGHNSMSRVTILTHIIQVLVRSITMASNDGLSPNLVQVFTSMSQSVDYKNHATISKGQGPGHGSRSKVAMFTFSMQVLVRSITLASVNQLSLNLVQVLNSKKRSVAHNKYAPSSKVKFTVQGQRLQY